MDHSLIFSYVILFVGIFISACFLGLAVRFMRVNITASNEAGRLTRLGWNFNRGLREISPDDYGGGRLLTGMGYEAKKDAIVCVVRRISHEVLESSFK